MAKADSLDRHPDACPKCRTSLKFRTPKWNRGLDIMELKCNCGWECTFLPADQQATTENKS